MPNKNVSSRWYWLVVSAFVVLLDQWSKYWVMTHMHPSEAIRLLPWLNIVLRFNQGAAFSFLSAAGGWQVLFLIVFVFAVSVTILVWLLRLPANESLSALALSLLLGGAVGNLIDRIRFGYVIDFIDFHIRSWHYATFNIADSAVCLGAFFLFIKLCVTKKSK